MVRAKPSKRIFDADNLFMGLIYLVLFIILVVMVYPLIVTLSCSLSNPMYVMQGKVVFLPIQFTLKSYKKVLEYKDLWMGFGNSVYYTVLGTFINIVLTVCAAYPLSRKDMEGRKFFMGILLVTMFFGGGMIPVYLLVKQLNLLNTVWSLVLPGAISTYNVIIMRTFFENTIPDGLLEAAEIDGCGNTRFLVQIVMPLSRPILTIIGLFYAVVHWNSFQDSLLYISSRAKFPLQLILREILLTSQTGEMTADVSGLMDQLFEAEGIKYAMIVVSSMPFIIAYPFVQKFFQKGVMLGAIKG